MSSNECCLTIFCSMTNDLILRCVYYTKQTRRDAIIALFQWYVSSSSLAPSGPSVARGEFSTGAINS
jgi:hypothetical protein